LAKLVFVIAATTLLSACGTYHDVDLVDRNATVETRALFANLQKVARNHVLFGHQDDLAYGVNWKSEPGRSDVKDVAGSYPAVLGWELGDLEHGSEVSLDSVNFESMKQWIIQGFGAGAVITISWHMDNPATGGNSWDPTPAVPTILPGGEHHETYKRWLDRFAAFNRDLETGWLKWLGFGTQVPIVFRPFHEHTGSWFWWGGDNVSPEDYVRLWRFTVEYLRDVKGVHNLLYAYSPDRFNTVQEYLEYYPGDEYVDILGMDDYSLGRPSWAEGLVLKTGWRLSTVARLAEERGKVAAFTETGAEGIKDPTWWTGQLLATLKSDSLSQRVAWVLVWRNANESHHYAPYRGHPSASDFVQFYKDPLILFADDLPDMYR
jgi:mannan endo-1,4-beta-mannosidase